MTDNYLTCRIVGGLGNQLFMIAALFGLRKIIGDIKLVIDRNTGTYVRPSYWHNFFRYCLEIHQVLTSNLPTVPWEICGEGLPSEVYMDYASTIEQNRMNGKSTFCKGYFQNLRYLPDREYILDLFDIRMKQHQLRSIITTPEATCAVHFRLGDYKELSHIHTLLPDSYYENAIRAVLDKNKNIKILLVFVEREDRATAVARMTSITKDFPVEVRFALDLKLSDWEEMIVMSLCAGVVMANSSFSWWGAYLNCQSDCSVTFPWTWYNGETQEPELSIGLPGWMKIGSDGSVSIPSSITAPICIDVGSHDGADSIKLYNTHKTRVYGFEPHPRFFNLTVQNTKHNKNIEILPFAVSDKYEKFITLNESRGDQSHSILKFKSPEENARYWPGCYAVHPSGRTFTVRMTRLDDFLESRGYVPETLIVSYLHVDAQGVDLEVLKSLGKYLPCVKAGVVEVAKIPEMSSYQDQQGTIVSVKEFLLGNGFNIDAVRPNDRYEETSCEFNVSFSQ